MTGLERRMRALLRWYPRTWRERHGEVMLATLLDDAEARGLDRPARADAWSIRVHGAADRANPATAALAAGVGLLLLLAAIVAQSSGVVFQQQMVTGGGPTRSELWQIAMIVATLGLGTPLVSIAMIALTRVRMGAAAASTLGAMGAVVVAAGALTADAVRTVLDPVVDAAGLVSVTGVPQQPTLVVAGVVAGVGLLPFVHDLVLRPSRPLARWAVAFVSAAVLAAVGVGVSLTGLVWIVAFAVLVIALSTDVRRRYDARVAPSRDWSPAAVATLSGGAILLGLPAMLAIVVSSTMPGVLRDDGMLRLLSLAIVGSLLLLVALALVGRAWVGPIAWFAGAAYAAASLVTIVAMQVGLETASGSLVLSIASGLAGLGVACTLLPIAPGGSPVLRAAIAVVVGVTLAAIASQALQYVLAVVWLGGIPLLVVAIGRMRHARERPARDGRAFGSASV